MFPWVFEWQYEIGHYALLGAWYLVLTAIGLGLGYVFVRTMIDLRKGGGHGGGHH